MATLQESREKVQVMGTDGTTPIDLALCSSGEVKICSGTWVKTDVEVDVSSGLWVDGISGVHVYVESGAHVVADVNVEVSSGLWVDGISGVHVYQESGAFVTTQPGIQVSGTVAVSGEVDASVSGTVSVISGEVDVINTVDVNALSGLVDINQGGIQVSGAVIVSGLVGINSGRVDILSGEVHIMSGEVTLLGTQVSGTVAVSGDVNLSSGGYIESQLACADTVRGGPLVQITSDSGGAEICGSGDSWHCSGPVHSVIVKNLSGNSNVFIGGANCKPYSGYGFLLAPEEAIVLDVCSVCEIYACANTSGQVLSWIGTDY